ncbi:FAD/NAD(P)-binding domain-containing protein [Marasmius fiardii PR-910]|nr:FAD/NAD(P)-binding domain-containing protein [Marasmius fiardii PR-910]
MSIFPPHHLHPPSTEPRQVAEQWLKDFSDSLASKSPAADLFLEGSYWRDIISLTSDLRTFHSFSKGIKPFLDARSDLLVPDSLTLIVDHELKKPTITTIFPDLVLLQFGFTFRVSYGGIGTGIGRLAYTGEEKGGVNGWKLYTMFTCLDKLDGSVEKVGSNRSNIPIVEPWDQVRRKQVEFEDRDPDVLIIGGGHVGLEVAARLKGLDIRALVIEKNPHIGDNWRNRYESLAIHDTIWYDNPPYLSFPSSWPVFCSGGKLANFLESYAETLELAVWTSTEVVGNAIWDAKDHMWSVKLKRGGGNGGREEETTRTVKVRHLVFATGFGGGVPNVPKIPGVERFKGKVYHSSEFKSGREHRGEKAFIIGACNSAFDIAQNFIRHGVDVTMYQRSSTYIISATGVAMLLGATYNESTIHDLEWIDRANAAIPNVVVEEIQKRVVPAFMNSVDKEIITGLENVGFKTNAVGAIALGFGRGGGYYIDVGGCQDVIDGKIKFISGAGGGIKEFSDSGDGIVFQDGSKIEGVDVVVFATGFGKTKDSISPILGPEHTAKLPDKFWGLDEEGEMNGIWRVGVGEVEGVSVCVGNLAMARHMSEALAVQIKGKMEGILPGRY